ncbi:MAG: glycine cleavage system aminomethyltransferase GcvT [Spirochaetes bacterium]|nr:glycine cleavage system aminomethyltransferase GcvT [Spirochaetota bacterium]
MEEIKKTPLYETHKKLNGNIVDFHGVYLPVFYSSIQEEHEAVRKGVGIFDVSHMGNVIVKFDNKEDAVNKLNYLLPNDYSKIRPGKIIYSTMLNNNGGVIDDLLVMSISEELYHIVVNSTRKNVDYEWIKKSLKLSDKNCVNRSEELAIIAVQGPLAQNLLTDMSYNVSELKSFEVKTYSYDGAELLISRTGYTGEDGFELIIENTKSIKLFEYILEKGKKYDIKPCGLGCRDTLRLEAGLPLYGSEFDENHSPLQTMVKWSVKLNKSSDFIGKKAIVDNKDSIYGDQMIGFEVVGRSIPRTGMEILDNAGNTIGIVTSGTFSPTLKKNIGLAFINKEYVNSSDLSIKIRNKIEKIIKMDIPFYKRAKGA